MLLLKKTSRLGRAHLARRGTLTTAPPPSSAFEVGSQVEIIKGKFEGEVGEVKWVGYVQGRARASVALPGHHGLMFIYIEDLKEVP